MQAVFRKKVLFLQKRKKEPNKSARRLHEIKIKKKCKTLNGIKIKKI